MQSVRTSSGMFEPDVDSRLVSISREDVNFHPHSFADDSGRLFRWKGDLYRAISSQWADFFEGLVRDGTLLQLVERGLLIETTPTDLKLEGYAMVVKHRSIPFVSYPHEWSAVMLRDASVAIIDLAIEVTQRDLALKDGHPWNILFDAYTPIWVDLTSITPPEHVTGWRPYDSFCRFCYYPLILMSHGHERIARALIPEYNGVQRSELIALMRSTVASRFIFHKLLSRGLNFGRSSLKGKSSGSGSPLALLKQAKRDLESISLPAYEDKQQEARREHVRLLSASGETPQQRTLRGILTQLHPDAVLDLSRGETWTSILPATMGFYVVSAEADPARATTLYKVARENRLRILTLIMDFIKPTPSVGYSNHYSISAAERLKCDFVVALGLAHRAALENYLTFDLIAEGLSSFSKRWLLVDFVTKQNNGASNVTGFDSHQLPGFIAALRKQFSDVRVVSSGAGPEWWLLCEK